MGCKEIVKLTFVLCSTIWLISSQRVVSQNTIGESDIEKYTLNGSIGLQTHAYTTTQPIDRRQPLGGLFTADIDFSVLGIESGLDVRYSTDDNEFRQTINRFNFYGSWRWIRLAAGDVNPAYGKFGLMGTSVRGAELNLSPGLFIVDVAAGRLNRSVIGRASGGARRPSFERWIYAVKLGVGREEQTHFTLSGFYGEDQQNSLPDSVKTSGYGADRLRPPSENLGVTPAFQVSLFDDVFKIGAETTLSAFSRDIRSPAISADEAEIPSILTDIFTPRSSTRFTYAGVAHTTFEFEQFQLMTQFERIMPGFESMGLRQLRDDQQTISLNPSFQLFEQRWTFDGTVSISEDNLLDNRLSTQTRQNINFNSRVRITETVMLGFGYTRFETNTSSEDGSGQGDFNQLSQVFQLFPAFTITSGSKTHNLSLTGIYQAMNVEFPVQNGLRVDESNTITGGASYTLTFSSGLSLNSAANAVFGEAPGSDFTTFGGSAGAGYVLLNQKLNLNLTVNASKNEFERSVANRVTTNSFFQVNGSFVATYRLTDSNSLRFNIRSNNNTVLEGAGQGFSELEARLQFRQRF